MRTRHQYQLRGLGFGAAIAIGPVAIALATPITTSGDLCPATASLCRIDSSGLLPVADGAVLDFGSRTLEVARGGLDASGGSFAIHAGAVHVRPRGRLRSMSVMGVGGTIQVVANGALTIESAAGDAGEIDVSGSSGGMIILQAGGPLALSGQLRAVGLADDGDAGVVSLAAAAVTTGTRSMIVATSGRFGTGGTATIAAVGEAQLDGDINTAGGSGVGGADVTIDAGGNVELGGRIDASGTLDEVEGDGGSVAVRAALGAISLTGAINARASTAGTGGSVAFDATGPVTFSGPIVATGGAPDGSGGEVWVRTDGVMTQVGTTAGIEAGATGNGSSGGGVTIRARGGAVLRGIDVSAGSQGGDVTVLADVSLQVIGPIGADGFGGTGLAGSVDLRTSGTATIDGIVHADAPPGELGGVVRLLACAVNVPRGGQLSANGVSGLTQLRGDASLTVAGSINAGTENQLLTSGRGGAPIVAGNVRPAPSIAVDPTIIACGQTVATTSTTTTTTRTTTTRTSTTTTSTTIPSTSTVASTSTTAITVTSTSTTSVTATSTTTTVRRISTTSTSARPTSTTTSPSTTNPPLCGGLPCDDGDPCTADSCRDGACDHTPFPESAMLDCRVSVVRAAIDDVHFSNSRTSRDRLVARVEGIRRLTGRALERVGAHRERALRLAVKQVLTLRRKVERFGGQGSLPAAEVDRIARSLQTIASWLDSL